MGTEKPKTNSDNTEKVEINEETDDQLRSIISALRGKYKQVEGKQEEVCELYMESLKYNPKNLDVFKGLYGFIQQNIKTSLAIRLLEEIKSSYMNIVMCDPVDADALTKLGFIYVLEENLEEAERSFSTSLKINPKQTIALLGLSKIKYIQGDKEMAEDYLMRSIKVKETPEAMTALSGMLVKAGETEEAIKLLIQTITHDPGYPIAYYNLGTILGQQGREKDARILLHEAIVRSIQYQNIDVAIQATVNFYEAGAEKEAEEILDEIVKSYPENPEASFRLANIKYKLGKRDEAEIFYKKTLELDPKNKKARDKLEELNSQYAQEQNKPGESNKGLPVLLFPEKDEFLLK